MAGPGQFCGPCWKCKSDFWLPQSLYEAAKKSKRIAFFCPYGHEAVFEEGEPEISVLRRERDRLRQQLAMKDDLIHGHKQVAEKAIKEYQTLKASTVKARKRTAAGVCPCCNRSFRQMALHMKQKHPTFKAEQVA